MKLPHLIASLILCSLAKPNLGQQTSLPPSFDVVSIHQITARTEKNEERSDVEIAPNGWRMNDAPLFAAIINAYTPVSGGGTFYTLKQVQGLPAWAKEDRYVIDAKIAESDLAKWHDSRTQANLQQTMMRTMLEERCKLRTHRETRDAPIYLLTMGKSGPTFKETVPGTSHPAAGAMAGGGEFRPSDSNGVMHFYGVPITAVAGVLSNITGRTVQDATALKGRYDVALKMPSMESAVTAGSDSGGSIFSVVDDLGLKLTAAKGIVEVLIVDHIERPSEN